MFAKQCDSKRGQGSVRVTAKPFCKVCFDTGKSEKEYSSHFVRLTPDPKSKVCCPTLLDMECQFCHLKGHTVSKCTRLAKLEKPSLVRHVATIRPSELKKVAKNLFEFLDDDDDDDDDDCSGPADDVSTVALSVTTVDAPLFNGFTKQRSCSANPSNSGRWPPEGGHNPGRSLGPSLGERSSEKFTYRDALTKPAPVSDCDVASISTSNSLRVLHHSALKMPNGNVTFNSFVADESALQMRKGVMKYNHNRSWADASDSDDE